jgi:hypothetical protein
VEATVKAERHKIRLQVDSASTDPHGEQRVVEQSPGVLSRLRGSTEKLQRVAMSGLKRLDAAV